MPSPLFRNFQARKKAAAKAAKATARRAAKSAEGRAARRALQSAKRNTGKLIEAGLKQLGKVGTLLGGLLKMGGVSEKEALDVVNRAVQDSGQQPPTVSRTPPTQPARRPPPPPRTPPQVTFKEAPRPDSSKPTDYSVRVGGRNRRYDVNDPTITGEMIDVQSSNVHSIGYDFNWDNPMQGTLKVRFLQGPKESKKAGPLYFYMNVHPDVFQAFQDAVSKGKFVWDRLRIRGTVTGHQYQYKLAGITGGYVPRQAKKYGPNQYFVQRRFKGTHNGEIREFESSLPDQRVGRYEPRRGEPNRGIPNRGS